MTLQHHGTSSASVPLALDVAGASGRINKGDLLLLAFVYFTIILRFTLRAGLDKLRFELNMNKDYIALFPVFVFHLYMLGENAFPDSVDQKL